MQEDFILTKAIKSDKDYKDKRILRIKEAISFKSGTIKNPKKTIVTSLLNSKEVYFLKPGKETQRAKPNKYDMNPNVGKNNESETKGFAFEDMWEYLIKISIINQITFKKVLCLLYRLCYFLDHQIIDRKKLRYLPKDEIIEYINKINYSLKDGFLDKFKKPELGLLEYLHFIDILGWNEDVKYHIEKGKPCFAGKYDNNVGRVNTIKSIISVPLMINDFLHNIFENVEHIERINVRLILSTMQKLSKSRGICVMSNVELVKYLQPYLEL
jgi:hypothetical protein